MIKKSNQHSGQKRRFGTAGIINVLITNAVLQALLASSLVSMPAATMISQGVNTSLGYIIYGKIVFKSGDLRHHLSIVKYIILMISVWFINTIGISLGEALSINKNLTAVGMIPILAVLSFLGQKYWVFNR